MKTKPDEVDEMLAQWGEERPDLDSSGMAVVLRIFSLAGTLSERLKSLLATTELAPFEYDVLSALRRAGREGATPKTLCRSAQLTSGAMTHRLDRLEDRRLVRRRRDREDRRSVTVVLTARGKKVVDAILGARMRDAAESLSALSNAQRRELARLLSLAGRGLGNRPD